MKQRIFHAVLNGLTASLYVLLALVLFARDYEAMKFIRMYGVGLCLFIMVLEFIAWLTAMGGGRRAGVALLGLFLIWIAAFVLAPL